MNKKRALAFLLALVMLVGIAPVALSSSVLVADANTTTAPAKANSAGSADRWGKQDTYWETTDVIEETPMTIEALVRLPSIKDTTHWTNYYKQGVLAYGYDPNTGKVLMEVGTGSTGRPYLKVVDTKGTTQTYSFGGNAYPWQGSGYTHMTFVIDTAAKTVYYYENGVLDGTLTKSLGTFPSNIKWRLGAGGNDEYNEYPLRGALHYVAMYNEMLTVDEILANCAADAWADKDSLIAAWDISKQGENALRDRSGNGHNLVLHGGDGIRFDTFGSYTMDQPLSGMPETVEAWLWMPRAYYTRGGTFLGNYGAGGSTFAFEIQNNGHPRFFYSNAQGSSSVHIFDQVDVRHGEWVHVAMVHDPNAIAIDELTGNEIQGAVHCYVNGVLAQTCAFSETTYDSNNKAYQTSTVGYASAMLNSACYLGGDYQGSGQTQRYNGYLKELRIYSDQRTAEEIASDYAGNVDYTDSAIVLHYELDATDEFKNITDLTGNGHNVTYNQTWYSEVLPVEDYAYSLAVVGDTQTVTVKNADKLKNIYQWILDNQASKKIQYVIGLGDITEKGEDWGHKNNDTEEETVVGDKEWAAALEAISMMDGKIPYSLVRGAGHDGVERFNEWFGTHEGYTSQIDGYYKEGRIENTYHTFKIGNVDYMILCLDFGAKDDVLEWANEVVAAHPAHRVIVTTHAYLEPDGTLLETGEDYCPSESFYDPTNNDGDDIWNKFVRKHANICMVMSGHMTCDSVVTSTQIGDHGNVVRQILIDPQGLDTTSSPRGMVAMLYFSADGTQVDVQYYSTITNTYRPNSEFTVSYGATEAADYDTLSEEYLVVQDQKSGLYSVVKNDYFAFLGGALRYTDSAAGNANLRFGYLFDSDFTLENWEWDYGVKGSGLASNKKGTNKNASNRTNLVITGIPAAYFSDGIEARLSFELTIDGVTYTAIDRVRERSVLGVATSIVKSPNESDAAKAYAQAIVDALTVG